MSRAIVIFARAPEVEAAVKGLPARFARVFHRTTAAWLRAASFCEATPVIACAPHARARFDAILSEVDRLYVDQRGASFGERLASSAEAAFALGFDEVLITGIDAPVTRASDVFAALRHARAVVEPAQDGGINLIALHAPERALLSALQPRQRDVLERCRAYFDSLVVLDVSSDIDSYAVDRLPVAEMSPGVPFLRPQRQKTIRPPPCRDRLQPVCAG
jgi:glycosyltransferase A (GT-A) superfamily protein (DUF2064 family)